MRLRIRELTCACCGGRITKNGSSSCPDCDALLHIGCWEHACSGETTEEAKPAGSGRLPATRRLKVRWWRLSAASAAAALLIGVPLFLAEDERQVVVLPPPPVVSPVPSVFDDAKAAERLAQSAVEKFNLRDFDGALVDLQAAVKEDPGNELAQLYLGLTYYELGCPQVAIQHYTRLIEDGAEGQYTYLAYYNRAWNRHLVGDQAGAFADAQRAAERAPGDERFARFMALLNDLAGQREEAASELRKAMQLDARSRRPRLWLAAYTGDVSVLLGTGSEDTLGKTAQHLRGQLSAAELSAWVELHDSGELGEVQFLLGLVAERRGDLEAARGHYAECIAHGGPGEVARSWARARLDQLAGE